VQANFTTRFISPTKISWPDLVNRVEFKGGIPCPNPQQTPIQYFLYLCFPTAACISKTTNHPLQYYDLQGTHKNRYSLIFVGNHRNSSVFIGVFMKLGDIRMNYLKSISLPDTIPTRLVPASWTLLSALPGHDDFSCSLWMG
jgi:cytochrome c oxidase subunit IV